MCELPPISSARLSPTTSSGRLRNLPNPGRPTPPTCTYARARARAQWLGWAWARLHALGQVVQPYPACPRANLDETPPEASSKPSPLHPVAHPHHTPRASAASTPPKPPHRSQNAPTGPARVRLQRGSTVSVSLLSRQDIADGHGQAHCQPPTDLAICVGHRPTGTGERALQALPALLALQALLRAL